MPSCLWGTLTSLTYLLELSASAHLKEQSPKWCFTLTWPLSLSHKALGSSFSLSKQDGFMTFSINILQLHFKCYRFHLQRFWQDVRFNFRRISTQSLLVASSFRFGWAEGSSACFATESVLWERDLNTASLISKLDPGRAGWLVCWLLLKKEWRVGGEGEETGRRCQGTKRALTAAAPSTRIRQGWVDLCSCFEEFQLKSQSIKKINLAPVLRL